MPRPFVFAVETTLYHPAEGKRIFPVGETDPGAAWTEQPGGEPVGSATARAVLEDLIAAQGRIDELEAQLQRNAADLAESAKTRDEAIGKAADLEQQLVAAQKIAAEAEELSQTYMRERDQARADLAKLQAKKAKPESAEA